VAEIRLELVRGHWSLGEYEEALTCVGRAVEYDPEDPQLIEVLDQLISESELQPVPSGIPAQLAEFRERITLADPSQGELELATVTMAELLEQQGHPERAAEVAEEVLRRQPDEDRAQQLLARLTAELGARDHVLTELERWLSNARAMQQWTLQQRRVGR
jgi:tetratricopeptide (TPR) repeat protein